MRSARKFALTVATMASVATVVLLVTGWGSAVAAQVSSVFVTNDASHPVSVHEQGTASVQVANDAAHAVPVAPQGTVPVTVGGTVATRTEIPATQFSDVFSPGRAGVDAVISGPDPAGTSYAISTIAAADNTTVAGGGETGVVAAAAPGNTCPTPPYNAANYGPVLVDGTESTPSISFTQPYILSPPTSTDPVCLMGFIVGGAPTVSVVGYRIAP